MVTLEPDTQARPQVIQNRRGFPAAKPFPLIRISRAVAGRWQKRLTHCAYSTKTRKCLLIWNHLPRAMAGLSTVSGWDKCPRLSIVGKRWRENPVLYAIREILGDGFKIRVPTPVLSASKRDRLQALAGLMDSDGSLSGEALTSSRLKGNLRTGFLPGSQRGLAAYVSKTKKTCQTGAVGDYWRVSISGDCAMVPTKIARKKADTRQQKKDVLRTGFSTEAKEDGEYFGSNCRGRALPAG